MKPWKLWLIAALNLPSWAVAGYIARSLSRTGSLSGEARYTAFVLGFGAALFGMASFTLAAGQIRRARAQGAGGPGMLEWAAAALCLPWAGLVLWVLWLSLRLLALGRY